MIMVRPPHLMTLHPAVLFEGAHVLNTPSCFAWLKMNILLTLHTAFCGSLKMNLGRSAGATNFEVMKKVIMSIASHFRLWSYEEGHHVHRTSFPSELLCIFLKERILFPVFIYQGERWPCWCRQPGRHPGGGIRERGGQAAVLAGVPAGVCACVCVCTRLCRCESGFVNAYASPTSLRLQGLRHLHLYRFECILQAAMANIN